MTASSAMPSKQVLMIVNLAWPYLLNPISHVGRRSNFTSIACICRSTKLPSTELCTDLLPTSLFLVSLRTSTKDCKTMCLGLPLMTSFKLWGSLHRRKIPIETDTVSFKVPASGTHLSDTLSPGHPFFDSHQGVPLEHSTHDFYLSRAVGSVPLVWYRFAFRRR